MILTAEQLAEFEKQGFVVVKGFFDRDVMTKVSTWLDTLRDRQPADQEEAKYYEENVTGEENILVRIENVFTDGNVELKELLLPEKAIQCLTQLFGEPPVLFKEKVNYKLPGCRPDKLHQDKAAGWNEYGDYYISMGIVVDGNRKDNAALSFLCSGNYEKRLMSEEWKPLSEADPPYSPEDEYLLLEADPGDVIFFDSYVPHGSPANTSARARRNIFVTFNRQSDGDNRQRYYEDKWAKYPPNDAEHARESRSFLV